jgi:8-amino-7-oxononanoate synthase
MSTLDERLIRQLHARAAVGNLRHLSPPLSGIDFYSNDYLGIVKNGLTKTPADSESVTRTGSTGSRLLSGNSRDFEELEHLIAVHHGAEAALVFNSGFEANVGLITAVAGRHTVIIYDELCHASIIDAVRSATCLSKHKFQHNSVADLERLLDSYRNVGELVVVTESLFSMDGDLAPLVEIAALCNRVGAALIVDEAHATGVFGAKGAGLVSSLNLEKIVFARVHTFGKALGGFGAAVVGSATLRSYLVNFSRPFIYTTALPPTVVRHLANVYCYLNSSTFSNTPLQAVIAAYNQIFVANIGLNCSNNNSPIQVIRIGDNELCSQLANQLQRMGFAVKAIKSPTVAVGTERLRICLHAFNTPEELLLLHNALHAQSVSTRN